MYLFVFRSRKTCILSVSPLIIIKIQAYFMVANITDINKHYRASENFNNLDFIVNKCTTDCKFHSCVWNVGAGSSLYVYIWTTARTFGQYLSKYSNVQEICVFVKCTSGLHGETEKVQRHRKYVCQFSDVKLVCGIIIMTNILGAFPPSSLLCLRSTEADPQIRKRGKMS